MPSRPVLPYIWMLLGALAFSVMGALAHGLREHIDWKIIALVRTSLAMTFAAVLTRAAGAKLVFWRPTSLWVRSIAGSVSLVCTFYALTRLPISDVLTLTNMFPIWIALLSWPLLGEAPSLGTWIAVVCGVAGVGLVQQPHLAAGNFAALVALASSFSTSVAMLGLHRLHAIDPRAIVVHFSAVSTLTCLIALALFDHTLASDQAFSPSVLLGLVGLGLSATTGQLFLTKAFAAGPPAQVSVVGLTQVAFAMLFDVAIWDRRFSPLCLLGMALVIAPTAWLILRQNETQTDDL